MIRRPPRSTPLYSSAASDVYKRQNQKGMRDRVIDLDLILFGDLIMKDQDIELPSSDIEDYLFILEPLAQIAEKEIHPVLNISFGEMLKEKLK